MGTRRKGLLVVLLFSFLLSIAAPAAALGEAAPLRVSSWDALQRAIDGAQPGDVIALAGDVTAGRSDRALTIPEGKILTLDLSGHALDRGLGEDSDVYDPVLRVSGGAVLTIRDSGSAAGLITGGCDVNGGGVYNRGTLILEGGRVAGNAATEDGGGIINYGILILKGGVVTGNTAGATAGGVYNHALGVMTAAQGSVFGNSAPQYADMYSDGSLTIPGVQAEKTLATRSYLEQLSALPVVALLIALLLAVRIDAYLDRERKRILYVVVALVLSLALQNYLDYRLSLQESGSALRVALSIYGYSARPAILALFLPIVRPGRRYWAAWALIGANAAVYLTAFFSPVAFYFFQNHFMEGPLVSTCTVVSALLLFWLVVLSMRQLRPAERKESWLPLFAVALIAGSVYLDYDLVYPDQPVSFLTIAIGISCVFYYIWLHLQFVREHEQALRAEQRIQIMMTQIQPHFLFNTLSTIRALCAKDPPKAIRIIEQFSLYLRQNLETLDRAELIPLTRELEHTRIYVQIEQQRFPHVRVSYDIQDEDLKVPALTIQPLVENAIRHGVRGREEGIVEICTRREGAEHLIVIRDNGVGFDVAAPRPADARHIGLENVRGRIEGMLGGSMTVESRVGEGTTVTLRLPAGEESV